MDTMPAWRKPCCWVNAGSPAKLNVHTTATLDAQAQPPTPKRYLIAVGKVDATRLKGAMLTAFSDLRLRKRQL